MQRVQAAERFAGECLACPRADSGFEPQQGAAFPQFRGRGLKLRQDARGEPAAGMGTAESAVAFNLGEFRGDKYFGGA